VSNEVSSPNRNESVLPGNDVWIPSACGLCYNQCGIRGHRVDGTLIKIEGNPDNPIGRGRLCARGLAGIQLLYDPHRVNYPMRRTNPEKGIGVDPGWEQISWDEALDEITARLEKIHSTDPRGLFFSGTVISLAPLTYALATFMPAFGSPNAFVSDGHQCGNAEHILARTLHASVTTNPDVDHCNYLLLFGCQAGLGTYYALTTMAQDVADARIRGMKLVVVDPYLSSAAEKADEWIPIKPGSDGALACALLNLLVNEYGLFDAEYLSHHADGPYLVTEDGWYARDPERQKPLVWDLDAGKPRPFDAPDLGRLALEGTHVVDGSPCRTVFQALKDQVAKWTPEAASEVTTIPAETIRRIAREFGEAASIGKTIEIDGVELPHRPACSLYFKGAHGHDNAWPTSLAIELLNEIVGASNVPGGLLGTTPVCTGHPETGFPRWAPSADADGLLETGALLYNDPYGNTPGWPPPPEAADLPNLRDLIGWPITTCFTPAALNDKENFSFDYEPEMLINYGSNLLMSAARPEVCAEAFKNSFVVSFNLFSDETAEALSDIILPDACYLERLDPLPNFTRHHHPVGLGDWGHTIRQPIVAPMYERRHFAEVMLELGQRLNIGATVNLLTNNLFGLMSPHALEPERDYSWEEISDHAYRGWFGEEHDLDWFREHGVMSWPKKVEEVFWKPSSPARAPIYHEWVKRCGEQVERIARDRGMDGVSTKGFLPRPDWYPCQAWKPREGYDLQAIYYRVPWHTFSMTYENPWLDEISQGEPYSYFICINTATARAKGIADGEPIEVEGVDGGKITGRARTTEGIHPEVLAVANNGGHWAHGMPFARGKGVFFNQLLPMDLEHTDLVSLSMDCDARVRVRRLS
jgi:molybdopterin-containing oxidoreductase family molybdopterin binding subunit